MIDNVVAEEPGSIHYRLATYSSSLLDNLRFDSYVPPPGGAGSGPANSASLDLSDFSYYFNWNTRGSPLGTYKWLYTARNEFGSDDGSITVRITQVPEPASWWLAAIGMGWIVNAWRRRTEYN